jgi:hypothetical protein
MMPVSLCGDLAGPRNIMATHNTKPRPKGGGGVLICTFYLSGGLRPNTSHHVVSLAIILRYFGRRFFSEPIENTVRVNELSR